MRMLRVRGGNVLMMVQTGTSSWLFSLLLLAGPHTHTLTLTHVQSRDQRVCCVPLNSHSHTKYAAVKNWETLHNITTNVNICHHARENLPYATSERTTFANLFPMKLLRGYSFIARVWVEQQHSLLFADLQPTFSWLVSWVVGYVSIRWLKVSP